jgi:hypothetical protein
MVEWVALPLCIQEGSNLGLEPGHPDVLLWFSQSLQAYAETVTQIMPSLPSQFITHYISYHLMLHSCSQHH